MRSLDDYAAMGIPYIWVIDSKIGVFKRFADKCLIPLAHFDYQDRGIIFEISEIAALLQH